MESGPGPATPEDECRAMAALLQHPVSRALVGAHLNDYVDQCGPRRHIQECCGQFGAASLVGCCREAVEWSRGASSPLHRWARDAAARWPDPPMWPIQRKLSARLRYKVPAKKRHEVAQLAPLVADLCSRRGARVVVDLGAGQGALAAALVDAGLYVVAIESSPANCAAARERVDSLHSTGRGPAGGPFEPAPLSPGAGCSVVQAFADQRLTPNALLALLKAHLPSELSSAGVVLVGLHPCGDLGSHLLRLAAAPALVGLVRGAVLVSCCWNLLTEGWHGSAVDGPSLECVMRHAAHASSEEEEEEEEEGKGEGGGEAAAPGYPLSRTVAAMGPTLRLGSVARNMACQSFEREAGRCTEESLEKAATALYYRALLNWVLLQHYAAEAPGAELGVGLRRPPASAQASFPAYAAWAIEQRLGLPLRPSVEALEAEERKSADALEEARLAVACRPVLGRAVEHLLLLDRLWFAREQGCSASLLHVFDGERSPRNIALVVER